MVGLSDEEPAPSSIHFTVAVQIEKHYYVT